MSSFHRAAAQQWIQPIFRNENRVRTGRRETPGLSMASSGGLNTSREALPHARSELQSRHSLPPAHNNPASARIIPSLPPGGLS